MKKALIIGASGGIGRALKCELESRDYSVSRLSRSEHGLDLTDEQSIVDKLGSLQGSFELIVVATGALTSGANQPEKSLDALNMADTLAQFQLNAVGPALVLKHTRHLLARKQRSVFAVLSARVGSIGDNRMGGWYSYRASKTALNALIRSAAIELGRSHRYAVLVCLHPGTVATDFTKHYPDHAKVTPEKAAIRLADLMAELTPAQTGSFLDYSGRAIPW